MVVNNSALQTFRFWPCSLHGVHRIVFEWCEACLSCSSVSMLVTKSTVELGYNVIKGAEYFVSL
jgi:hypothetical protein